MTSNKIIMIFLKKPTMLLRMIAWPAVKAKPNTLILNHAMYRTAKPGSDETV